MCKEKGHFKKIRLTLLFAAMVFLIILLTLLLIFTGMLLLYQFGIVKVEKFNRLPFFLFAIVSLIVGTILAAILSRRPLSPLRDIMNAADQIASGNYSARINLKGLDEFKQLNDSFNNMAEEIGSVEMLRSDFVNNFSHEFKTPIVSIRGFAKMLKRDDLTAEEKNEYLDIIIGESERLTELATNVLNLSKIEQQSILTDKTRFNVSEQIRLVIAVLDSKWSEKHIDISFDCEETFLYGNEELLKQVWINLLDNAIKFSPDCGKVEIEITVSERRAVFTFTNQGDGITPEIANHIFDRFYQGDTSHITKGNGLGLAIAKKIVELHNGSIRVSNLGETRTTLEVSLTVG